MLCAHCVNEVWNGCDRRPAANKFNFEPSYNSIRQATLLFLSLPFSLPVPNIQCGKNADVKFNEKKSTEIIRFGFASFTLAILWPFHRQFKSSGQDEQILHSEKPVESVTLESCLKIPLTIAACHIQQCEEICHLWICHGVPRKGVDSRCDIAPNKLKRPKMRIPVAFIILTKMYFPCIIRHSWIRWPQFNQPQLFGCDFEIKSNSQAEKNNEWNWIRHGWDVRKEREKKLIFIHICHLKSLPSERCHQLSASRKQQENK